MPTTLSPRALCTLEDVIAYSDLKIEQMGDVLANGVTREDMITRLINAASQSIHQAAGREFIVIGSNPQTRVFDVDGRSVSIGDLATLTAVSLTFYDGTSPTVLASPVDYTLLPRIREEWEPYVRLRLETVAPWHFDWWEHYTAGGFRAAGYALSITGTWGFPIVPDDIRQACIVTVLVWLERDLRHFSETFSIEEQRVELPRSLPRQVYDTVLNYRIAVV